MTPFGPEFDRPPQPGDGAWFHVPGRVRHRVVVLDVCGTEAVVGLVTTSPRRCTVLCRLEPDSDMTSGLEVVKRSTIVLEVVPLVHLQPFVRVQPSLMRCLYKQWSKVTGGDTRVRVQELQQAFRAAAEDL